MGKIKPKLIHGIDQENIYLIYENINPFDPTKNQISKSNSVFNNCDGAGSEIYVINK